MKTCNPSLVAALPAAMQSAADHLADIIEASVQHSIEGTTQTERIGRRCKVKVTVSVEARES